MRWWMLTKLTAVIILWCIMYVSQITMLTTLNGAVYVNYILISRKEKVNYWTGLEGSLKTCLVFHILNSKTKLKSKWIKDSYKWPSLYSSTIGLRFAYVSLSLKISPGRRHTLKENYCSLKTKIIIVKVRYTT